jgi:hypothetical protein
MTNDEGPRDPLAWRVYERAIAAMEAESVGLDYSVTPNARLVGVISGSSRQIDVLIDMRWGDDDDRSAPIAPDGQNRSGQSAHSQIRPLSRGNTRYALA